MRNIKNFTRSAKAAVSVFLAALLFSSCSAITLSNNENASATQSASASAAAPEKQSGGELFIAMPPEIDSFDPLLTRSEDMINLLSLVYETPLSYGSDGQLTENLVSYYEVNDAKTEFTFHLRESVYFSDGVTRLTASDVKYSADRVLALTGTVLNDPAQGAANPDETGTPEDAQDTPEEETETPAEDGGEEETVTRSRYELFNEYVQYIEVIDESTIKLTMNKAGSAGLHFMTFPVLSEQFADQTLPVGTGPYKVDSLSEASETEVRQMVLVQNEHWRKPAPYIERIVARAAGSEEKLDEVETSILDFVTTDALYAGRYEQAGRTQVIDYMTNYYDCIVPNLDKEALKSADVRKAISNALDRREIISTVLLSHAVPVNMPIAPDYFAFDAQYKINDYDLGLAKELLTQAGYRTDDESEGNILTLKFIVEEGMNNSYRKEAARAITKQLAEAGIVAELSILGTDDYKTALYTGDFDIAYCSYYMDIVPDIGFLFEEGSLANVGSIGSTELQAAMDSFNLAVTTEEITVACSALQKTLSDLTPQIGICYRMNSMVCDEALGGISGARENMVFSQINEWYYGFLGEQVLQPSASASPGVEAGEEDTASQEDEPAEE